MSAGEDIVDDLPEPAGHEADVTVPLEDWPPRPWLLAGIGALAGLLIHWIVNANSEDSSAAAVSAFLFFGAAAAGFVLRPRGWIEAVVFSVLLGAVMAGVTWLAVDSGDRYSTEGFAFAAGVFFSLLAIPLFQAGFHRLRWQTPYADTHFHVWTDAVSAAGAFAFVLLSWLLLWLMHALFSLIGIAVIESLIQSNGFAGFFIGGTFGAAMGVLRNQLGIIGTLQRVVMLVFSLLAVPFAAGVAIFLVILLVTGGNALWDATDSATPVLLSCAVGCFILSNAVFRDDDAQRSENVVMQAAALVLAAAIFPLTVFAAISMGIRIDQHGLSPERIWALVAIVIATAYGLAYWVGLVRGRMAGWAHYLRRANLHLAVVTCVVALVLAFPLVDFGAISARDQVARLQSGEVAPEDFDFAALRWDFGDAGRDALAELAASEDAEIARLASDAENMTERYYGRLDMTERRAISENVDMAGIDEETAEAVRAYIRDDIYNCSEGCRVVELQRDERGVLLVVIDQARYASPPTLVLVAPGADKAAEQNIRFGRLREGYGAEEVGVVNEDADDAGPVIELRPFTGQQLYIDGEPAGDPFE